jgi:hypothetical protein
MSKLFKGLPLQKLITQTWYRKFKKLDLEEQQIWLDAALQQMADDADLHARFKELSHQEQNLAFMIMAAGYREKNTPIVVGGWIAERYQAGDVSGTGFREAGKPEGPLFVDIEEHTF